MPEPDIRTPDSSDSRSPAENLYTKSGRSSRTRLLDEQPRKKLISVEIGGTPRRRQSSSRHSPFQHIIKANTKKLAIVFGLMALLLIAAQQLVSLMSRRDVSKAYDTTNQTPANVSTTPSPSPASNIVTTVAPLAPTIDPTLFKKAVYLSKKAKAYEDAGDFDKAIQNYRESLDVLPNTPSVWAQLGRVYLKLKDFWHAQIALEKAVESNPTADLFNDLGVSYLWQEGKVDRALNMFQTATDVDPNYAPTYFNRGLAHLARGETIKARDALEQYLRMKPDDPRGLRERAVLRARDGDRGEALKDLEKAISEAPDWPLLYFDAAAINALNGQCDTAIRYLEKAMPLSSAPAVFKIWQEPAFRECRLSEIGKVFEKDVADGARAAIKEKEKPVPTGSEPIVSTTPSK